jgi:tetrahydromethanopterin S-methyltransferase subunit E
MSGLVVVFMLFDGAIKLIPLDIVVQTNAELGYKSTPALIRSLGLIGIGSTILYAYPKTAVFGAILLTAYMGGAIASQLRIGSPLFTHVLFGAYLAILAWGGLYLRDPQIRALVFPTA